MYALMQYVLKMLCMLCALYMHDLYMDIFDTEACYVTCCLYDLYASHAMWILYTYMACLLYAKACYRNL